MHTSSTQRVVSGGEAALNVLVIPHVSWDVPQRMHDFVPVWTQRHAVHATNWDTRFTSPRDFLSARYLKNFVPRRCRSIRATVHHVPRFSPALHIRALREVNEWVFQRTVSGIVHRESIDVALGTFVTAPPRHCAKVVDLYDDNVAYWLSYGTNKAYAMEIRRREDEWIRASHVTVTVSSVLADKVTRAHPSARVVHVPNGVDTAEYVPARAEARRALGLSEDGIYVGNIGSLDKRVEARRLANVARRLAADPRVRLVVAGRGSEVPWLQSIVRKEGIDNVLFYGFVEGSELLRLFQSVDVGLCPYAITEGAHASVPLRLLRYSAVGATVVATRLKEVARMAFSNVVLSDDDDARYADAVLRALERTPHVPEGIKRYDASRLAAVYESVLAEAASA